MRPWCRWLRTPVPTPPTARPPRNIPNFFDLKPSALGMPIISRAARRTAGTAEDAHTDFRNFIVNFETGSTIFVAL